MKIRDLKKKIHKKVLKRMKCKGSNVETASWLER